MPALDQRAAGREAVSGETWSSGRRPRSETTRPLAIRRPGQAPPRTAPPAPPESVIRTQARWSFRCAASPRTNEAATDRRIRRRPAAPPPEAPACAASPAARAPSPRSRRSGDSARGSRRIRAAGSNRARRSLRVGIRRRTEPVRRRGSALRRRPARRPQTSPERPRPRNGFPGVCATWARTMLSSLRAR